MPTNLKLHRGDNAPGNDEPGESYPFPSDAVRSRLIAGTVEGDPINDAAAATGAKYTAPLKFPRHAVTTTPDLIRQIEDTLGRMQSKLDDFKRDVDRSFKFPTPPSRGNEDDWRPFAA